MRRVGRVGRVRRGNVAVRGMLALALVVGGSAALAAPAGAKVSAADCEVVLDLGAPETGAAITSSSDMRALAVQAKQLTANSKKVSDKKLAAAMQTLGSIYAKAAKARNEALAVAVIAQSGAQFTRAISTWGKAVTSCITTSITLPSDITLPRR